MRRLSVALISLSGLLILGACTGRDSTAPRGIAPDQANLASTPPAPATSCDFSAIKAAAKNYFTSPQDAVYGYIGTMQKAYGANDFEKTTNTGWQIGRLVAAERLRPLTTDATSGGIFVIDVLLCMYDLRTYTAGSTPPVLPIPADFTLEHAAGALGAGIWEIRGGVTGTNDEFPAAGRVISNTGLTAGQRDFGQPRWGVEPVSTTWPIGVNNTQYAVYGYPTTLGTFVLGSATNINTNTANETNAFSINTIPQNTPRTDVNGALFRVGVCVSTVANTTGVRNRMLHDKSVTSQPSIEILDNSFMQSLCDYSNTSFLASAASSPSWYAAVLHRAAGLFSPKLAYAMADDCADCIGGLPSGWSPFGTGQLTASQIHLVFLDTLPTNGMTAGGIPTTVRVKATISDQPVPGVLITLTISGNSGDPGGATFQNGQTSISGSTNSLGIAEIPVALQKAGSYTIVYTGTIDGYPVYNSFQQTVWVKNQ